tara:strand:- start:3660 stop:3800 length:141 start_codon:yes stop_codon:yes gene_type:complete
VWRIVADLTNRHNGSGFISGVIKRVAAVKPLDWLTIKASITLAFAG